MEERALLGGFAHHAAHGGGGEVEGMSERGLTKGGRGVNVRRIAMRLGWLAALAVAIGASWRG